VLIVSGIAPGEEKLGMMERLLQAVLFLSRGEEGRSMRPERQNGDRPKKRKGISRYFLKEKIAICSSDGRNDERPPPLEGVAQPGRNSKKR